MQKIGLWHVGESGPTRLVNCGVELEKHLEEWIEKDPSLLQPDLTIVGRQIQLDGGPLDLLALDPQGRWVIIEIKRGTLYRDAVAQALDYASSVATMDYPKLEEKVNLYFQIRGLGGTSLASLLQQRHAQNGDVEGMRDVQLYLVGTGMAPGLERMVEFLSARYEMPISIVLYDVFRTADGQKILTRELNEVDATAPAGRPWVTLDELQAKADQNGIGKEFRLFANAANGLQEYVYLHPWQRSLMMAPVRNRSRCLVTMWTTPNPKNGLISLYVYPPAFTEFYGIPEEDAVATLGREGYRDVSPEELRDLLQGIGRLLSRLEQTGSGSDEMPSS